MDWTTSCKDWERRVVQGRSIVPCGALFPDEANDALEVFKALRLVDVAGAPTYEEVGAEWIFDLVRAIFGSYDATTGRRLIREYFVTVAKKNGKSSLAAGVMLTALIRNWRQSNELLILAPTIEAAQNSFKPAADMVRADPDLSASDNGFLHIQDHLRTITHLKTGATLKVVAADSSTVVGKKAAFILIDELWEFGKKAKADAMLREATGGLASRPEGFVVSITTQSDEPPAGVFKDKLDYARQVRDGETEDRKFLPVIYEYPAEMVASQAYLDPSNFYVTNPNIGRSVSEEWLEDELRKEMAKGPETRNVFLAKHLNVQIGGALRNDGWAGGRYWEKRGDKDLTLEALIERSEVIVGGVDGGGLDDLMGLAFLGRERDTKLWLHWGHAWAHKDVLDRRKEIAPRLLDFRNEGDLTICETPTQDIEGAADLIERVKDAGLFPEDHAVGLDPQGVSAMVDELAGRGITEAQMVAVSQGYRLNGAILGAERKLADGTLLHGARPMMAWVVGNAKVESRGNAVIVTKQAAGRSADASRFANISPMASGVQALSAWGAAAGPAVHSTVTALISEKSKVALIMTMPHPLAMALALAASTERAQARA